MVSGRLRWNCRKICRLLFEIEVEIVISVSRATDEMIDGVVRWRREESDGQNDSFLSLSLIHVRAVACSSGWGKVREISTNQISACDWICKHIGKGAILSFQALRMAGKMVGYLRYRKVCTYSCSSTMRCSNLFRGKAAPRLIVWLSSCCSPFVTGHSLRSTFSLPVAITCLSNCGPTAFL